MRSSGEAALAGGQRYLAGSSPASLSSSGHRLIMRGVLRRSLRSPEENHWIQLKQTANGQPISGGPFAVCFSSSSTYIVFASFSMINGGNPLFLFSQNFPQSLHNSHHFGLVDGTDIKFNDAVIGLVFARIDRRILRF